MAAAAIPLVIAGLGALGGWLGNRRKTVPQEQTTTQNIDQTSTSMPTYDPTALAMRNSLMGAFMQRLSPDYAQNLASNITTNSIQNINRGFGATQRALEQSFANRGLNFSPVSAVVGAESQGNRIGQVIQALNNQRLLAEQMQQGNLSSAAGFFGQLPYGTTQHQTGTTTQKGTGTITYPGDQLGGLFGNLTTILAGLWGRGAFGGPKSTPTVPPLNV